MNHLTSFLHAFEHKDNSEFTSIEVLGFSQDADFAKSCFYCDIYLNLDYTEHESLVYSLIVPSSTSDCILNREKKLVSVVIHRKKSRSPPSHTS